MRSTHHYCANRKKLLAWTTRATLAGLIGVAGCAGRSDVTDEPGPAENLPAKPHAAPQQHPSPSQLPGVKEPGQQGQADHGGHR